MIGIGCPFMVTLYFPSFFFNDTATTEIYTLSLHDALPIWLWAGVVKRATPHTQCHSFATQPDRKSTRLNSSHLVISYAVFCLKKKQTRASSTSRNTRRSTASPSSSAAAA